MRVSWTTLSNNLNECFSCLVLGFLLYGLWPLEEAPDKKICFINKINNPLSPMNTSSILMGMGSSSGGRGSLPVATSLKKSDSQFSNSHQPSMASQPYLEVELQMPVPSLCRNFDGFNLVQVFTPAQSSYVQRSCHAHSAVFPSTPFHPLFLSPPPS